jgi:hypothetical protein
MHPSMPIKDINFDEMETKNWEYVMLDTIQFNLNSNEEDVKKKFKKNNSIKKNEKLESDLLKLIL